MYPEEEEREGEEGERSEWMEKEEGERSEWMEKTENLDHQYNIMAILCHSNLYKIYVSGQPPVA